MHCQDHHVKNCVVGSSGKASKVRPRQLSAVTGLSPQSCSTFWVLLKISSKSFVLGSTYPKMICSDCVPFHGATYAHVGIPPPPTMLSSQISGSGAEDCDVPDLSEGNLIEPHSDGAGGGFCSWATRQAATCRPRPAKPVGVAEQKLYVWKQRPLTRAWLGKRRKSVTGTQSAAGRGCRGGRGRRGGLWR
eukprot:495222-Rhodomonas_salina.2